MTTTTKPTTDRDMTEPRRHWRGWRDAQGKSPTQVRPDAARFEPRRPLSILAVDPGTRRTGVAVFEGQELVLGKVRDFGFQRSTATIQREARRLVEDHVRYFRPHMLVLERTFSAYQNKDISKLVAVSEAIRAVARERAIPLVEYAPRTARLLVIGNGNATKRQVAEALCIRYPELRIYLEQTHLWKETYWSNCFDAVCVGLAHLVDQRLAPPIRPLTGPAPTFADPNRPGS